MWRAEITGQYLSYSVVPLHMTVISVSKMTNNAGLKDIRLLSGYKAHVCVWNSFPAKYEILLWRMTLNGYGFRCNI